MRASDFRKKNLVSLHLSSSIFNEILIERWQSWLSFVECYLIFHKEFRWKEHFSYVLAFFLCYMFSSEGAEKAVQDTRSLFMRVSVILSDAGLSRASQPTEGREGGEAEGRVNLDLHNVYNNTCHATIRGPRYDLTQHKARHNVGLRGYANPQVNIWWPKRWLALFYSREWQTDLLTNYSTVRHLEGTRTCWNI